jgi:hypothetical protein
LFFGRNEAFSKRVRVIRGRSFGRLSEEISVFPFNHPYQEQRHETW